MGPTRICAHADESTQRPDGSFYMQMIWEGEPGYREDGVFPTLAAARTRAKSFNKHMGWSDQDVMDIRVSSMFPGTVR